jgi:hypothetical protein
MTSQTNLANGQITIYTVDGGLNKEGSEATHNNMNAQKTLTTFYMSEFQGRGASHVHIITR